MYKYFFALLLTSVVLTVNAETSSCDSISENILGSNSTFSNNCSSCEFNKETGELSATCKEKFSTIVVGYCLNGITVANNGDLMCTENMNKMNGGSYRSTCSLAHIGETRYVIDANCQKSDGHYEYTSIDVSTCPIGDLLNNGGVLQCNPNWPEKD